MAIVESFSVDCIVGNNVRNNVGPTENYGTLPGWPSRAKTGKNSLLTSIDDWDPIHD